MAAHDSIDIAALIGESAKLMTQVAADAAACERLRTVAAMTSRVMAGGGRLFLCGNGGSAAQATHFAGELVGPFLDRKRRAFPAIALGFDPSSLTATANDLGFERIFARQLEGLGQAGDILWGLSTSGNSPNVLAAFEQARAMNIQTVLLTNHDGGRIKALADVLLTTPPGSTARVQEIHLIYGHCLCQLIEAQLTGG